jgi:dephospho-CoA kinase
VNPPTRDRATPAENRAWILGVTGGIGAGKSSLCRVLSQAEGWPVLDADRMGHEALRRDSPTAAALVERFGAAILGEEGEIAREHLAAIVFNDPTALSALNAIVHPWIIDRIRSEAALRASRGADIIILDAALLLDWREEIRPGGIVMVRAPLRTRLRRLRERGIGRDDALRRIRTQSFGSGNRLPVDWCIDNDGTLEALAAQGRVLAAKVRERAGRARGADHPGGDRNGGGPPGDVRNSA